MPIDVCMSIIERVSFRAGGDAPTVAFVVAASLTSRPRLPQRLASAILDAV